LLRVGGDNATADATLAGVVIGIVTMVLLLAVVVIFLVVRGRKRQRLINTSVEHSIQSKDSPVSPTTLLTHSLEYEDKHLPAAQGAETSKASSKKQFPDLLDDPSPSNEFYQQTKVNFDTDDEVGNFP